MRLGIDLTWMGNRPAGVGTVAGELVSVLQAREDIELVLFKDRGARGLLKHWGLYKEIRDANLDVLWQAGGWLPLVLPSRLVTIQTVHDLFSFDHPEWFPQKGLSRWWSNNARVKRALRRADIVHCISKTTRKDLERLFPRCSSKALVAYQGVSNSSNPSSARGNYVLMMGTVEPRKNMVFACEVLDKVLEQADTSVVFAGKVGWKAEESMRAMRDLASKYSGRVVIEEYVSDERKWELLQGAQLLLMTSHAEGFGRPLVEAMNVGTPVAVSAIDVAREVVGDVGSIVDRGNVEAHVKAVYEVLEGRAPAREVLEAQAAKFSNKKMADAIISAARQRLEESL